MNEKSNLYIVAIVGIIAVVAIIILATNNGTTREIIAQESNSATANADSSTGTDSAGLATGPTCAQLENSCYDSDGNNIYIKGTTRLAVCGQASYYTDICVQMGPTQTGVLEYYCSGNNMLSGAQACPNGCVNGACIQTPANIYYASDTCGNHIVGPSETCDSSNLGYKYRVNLSFSALSSSKAITIGDKLYNFTVMGASTASNGNSLELMIDSTDYIECNNNGRISGCNVIGITLDPADGYNPRDLISTRNTVTNILSIYAKSISFNSDNSYNTVELEVRAIPITATTGCSNLGYKGSGILSCNSNCNGYDVSQCAK